MSSPSTASRFQDKVVVVTGAASGIGLAAAERFASEGARVVVADRDLEHATAAVTTVRQAGAPGALACVCACDVSDAAQVAACVDATLARFGALDVISGTLSSVTIIVSRQAVPVTGGSPTAVRARRFRSAIAQRVSVRPPGGAWPRAGRGRRRRRGCAATAATPPAPPPRAPPPRA